VTESSKKEVQYIYKKYKKLPIPFGTKGKIILEIDHPVTSKLLVDFGKYGKAIVPRSATKNI
jgi:hypothetical protein